MIFVAFLVPLALYLLVLGWINSQPRPIIISGVWDFVGLLFAASGFLLFGGPAVLSSLHERWRLFWMFGEGNPTSDGLDAARQVWLFLALVYFFVVVLGSAWILWRRRSVTCIYNTEPAVVEAALVEVCEHLGLAPVRSGNLFVFGMTLGQERQTPSQAITHEKPRPSVQAQEPVPGGQSAILELDRFETMKHVTLYWDPADSPLRPVLEAELAQRLARAGSPYHETGTWLGMTGSGLLVLALLAMVVLSLRTILMR